MKQPHMILKRRYTSYVCPSPSHVQHQDRTLMQRWALVYNNYQNRWMDCSKCMTPAKILIMETEAGQGHVRELSALPAQSCKQNPSKKTMTIHV